MQIDLLANNYPDEDCAFLTIVKFLRKASIAQRELLSQVSLLVAHILIMPATNSVCEQSISSLQRIKNYLLSTMTKIRLSHVMMLHMHKHIMDSLLETRF